MSLNYLNAFFKRSSPSFTVSSGQPMFIRKKPSPSGPKSMPLFKPIFASWSSFFWICSWDNPVARKSSQSKKEPSGSIIFIAGNSFRRN